MCSLCEVISRKRDVANVYACLLLSKYLLANHDASFASTLKLSSVSHRLITSFGHSHPKSYLKLKGRYVRGRASGAMHSNGPENFAVPHELLNLTRRYRTHRINRGCRVIVRSPLCQPLHKPVGISVSRRSLSVVRALSERSARAHTRGGFARSLDPCRALSIC